MLLQEDWNKRLIDCATMMLHIMSITLNKFNLQEVAETIFKLGTICAQGGKTNEALQCIFTVLKYNQTLQGNNGVLVAKCLLHFGEIYIDWNKYDSSLLCIEECYSISILSRDAYFQQKMINNIILLSDLCFKLHRFKESEAWVERGLDALKKRGGSGGEVHLLILKVKITSHLSTFTFPF